MSAKSSSACGERTSCLSGDDIRVDLPAAPCVALGFLRGAFHQVGRIRYPLPSVELVITDFERRAHRSDLLFFLAHATNGIANNLRCVAVEARIDLALDELLHFGG